MNRWTCKSVGEQAAVVALVCATALMTPWRATAAEDLSAGDRIVEIAPGEQIVEISPDGELMTQVQERVQVQDQVQEHVQGDRIIEAPAFWIGIAGQAVADPALRTHLQLAADTGLIVEQVVPGSPADKAGLKRHDVIIAVNGQGAHGMKELVHAVRTGAGGPLQFKVLRLAQEQTITVKPEERPSTGSKPAPPRARVVPGLGSELGDLSQRLQGLLQGQDELLLRVMGPGVIVQGRPAPATVPNGVQVSITRQNGGPASIIVRRGDESWTVTEGDEEAMAQLPADVRPFIERMLGQRAPRGAGVTVDLERLQEMLPRHLGNLNHPEALEQATQQAREAAERARERIQEMRERSESSGRELLERMKQMELRMQQMHQRLEEMPIPDAPAPPATPPVDDQTT